MIMAFLAMTPIATIPLEEDMILQYRRGFKGSVLRRIVAIVTITVAIAVPFWGILAIGAGIAMVAESTLMVLLTLTMSVAAGCGVLAGGVAWCEKHYANLIK